MCLCVCAWPPECIRGQTRKVDSATLWQGPAQYIIQTTVHHQQTNSGKPEHTTAIKLMPIFGNPQICSGNYNSYRYEDWLRLFDFYLPRICCPWVTIFIKNFLIEGWKYLGHQSQKLFDYFLNLPSLTGLKSSHCPLAPPKNPDFLVGAIKDIEIKINCCCQEECLD